MTRVKSPAQRKHRKILKLAKGYWMTRNRHFRSAMEAVLHAGEYAFGGRKLKKRDFRRLWIIRINAAVRSLGSKYSKFINALKKKNIQIDRKILSKIAVEYPDFFKKIFSKANS